MLRDRVAPAWEDSFPDAATDRLGGLPSVLQHHDLGSWNVVVDGEDFTAVDWESSRRHGFPLWDGLYFLADALAHLDGAGDRVDHALRLCRGELASSALLFDFVRTQVARLSLPPDSVGPLAACLWLYEGAWAAERARTVDELGGGRGAGTSIYRTLAAAWLNDPALGLDWARWRA